MCTASAYFARRAQGLARDQAPKRQVSRRFMDFVADRLSARDQKGFADLLDRLGISVDETMSGTPNSGTPYAKPGKDRRPGKDRALGQDEAGWATRWPGAARIGFV
jgi:hypothetical protein